jgi:eukaryotic-like serine/threonine-protein kinase
VTDADARIGRRYRLDKRLASGGMGTVWQGWDERLHRVVAVKRLHMQPGLSATERNIAIQRAMREARITARLHHPNAVEVYDIVDEAAGPCLIMQYVPSRSLQQMIRTDGPLPPPDVARIGTQIAGALAAAHRAGVVHRDVKPGNVLIAEDGTAKITDFGISRAFDDVTVTSTGLVMGTPAYLAPEVARGASSDFASDVYSLGATLYMAVEGRPPFGEEQNPMAVLHRAASGAWDPPVRAGALTPALQAMMATDPRRRPTMVEVANMLPQVHGARVPAPAPLPVAATQLLGDRRPPPLPPPEPEPERHRGWVPIAVAAVVVVLAAVLAVILLSNTAGGSPDASGRTRSGTAPARHHSAAHRRSRSHSRTPSSPHASAKSSTASSGQSSSASSSSSEAGSSSASSTSSAQQNGPAPSDQDLANAVENYFQVVPEDLDAGWQLLTPHFQQTAGGRSTYDRFWSSVERVDVSNATGDSPHDASATLTYHYKDGRVVTDATQFRFLRQGGVLKIDEES